MSNNPPRAVLELDQADAELMLQNCESNLRLSLGLMMGGAMSRENTEKLVRYNEFFKGIRTSLINQGIRNPDDQTN